MNTNSATLKDGQVPARRFGAILAIVISCMGCACLSGVWYFFARDGIDNLVNSISLSGSGETTTGTVTSVEEFSSGKANFPSTSYKLIVSFQVDGKSYEIRSNAYYKPIGKSWVGESMPILYNAEDPNIALIDTFQERWLEPVLNALP